MESSTATLLLRFLSNDNINTTDPNYNGIDNNDNNDNSDNSSESSGRNAYEFVAFLLWYLFLVMCCVVPTCCAYRRRRLMETRIAQQQAAFDQVQQHNVYILSNLHFRRGGRGGMDLESDEAEAERTKRITEALKSTTFVSLWMDGYSYAICYAILY